MTGAAELPAPEDPEVDLSETGDVEKAEQEERYILEASSFFHVSQNWK